MIILNELKDALQILKLNRAKMADVAGRKQATVFGIIFLLVLPVVNILLSVFNYPSGFGSIFSRYLLWPAFIPSLSFVATTFLISLIAERVFHGGKDHVGFFRIMAYASVVLWVTVVPFLLGVLGIIDAQSLFKLIYLLSGALVLYVAFNALMEHHKLTKEHAVLVIIAAIFIFMISSSILGKLLVGSGYRMLY
jgi:hypothetical protein